MKRGEKKGKREEKNRKKEYVKILNVGTSGTCIIILSSSNVVLILSSLGLGSAAGKVCGAVMISSSSNNTGEGCGTTIVCGR